LLPDKTFVLRSFDREKESLQYHFVDGVFVLRTFGGEEDPQHLVNLSVLPQTVWPRGWTVHNLGYIRNEAFSIYAYEWIIRKINSCGIYNNLIGPKHKSISHGDAGRCISMYLFYVIAYPL
jgi:hypothetical protein